MVLRSFLQNGMQCASLQQANGRTGPILNFMLYTSPYSQQLRFAADFLLLPLLITVLTLEHFGMYASGYLLHLVPQMLLVLSIGRAWNDRNVNVLKLFIFITMCMVAIELLEVTFHLYKRVPFDERGPVTGTSMLMLVACSVTAGKIYNRRTAGEAFSLKSPKLIWLLMAVGFAFLALDEKVLIHEGLDRMIYHGSGMAYSAFSQRMDDFIVLGYGLIGMGAVYWFRHEILRYKKTITVLCIGFGVFVVHSGLDMAGRPDFVEEVLHIHENAAEIAHAIDMLEEVCKLVAETCFFSGLLLALKGSSADAMTA